MKLYGTEAEARDISVIKAKFPGCEVIDPRSLQPSVEPGKETEYYLSVVDSCDVVVFARLFGNVTEGVRPEVDRALSAGKKLYELRGGALVSVEGPVRDLPTFQRISLRVRSALGITG